MATRRKTLLTAVGAAGFAATTLMGLASPAQAQAGKIFVMKLSTATINDTQHEWLQALRSGGREGFGRPHQGRDLSGEPARLDSAPDRRRAVRLDPGSGLGRLNSWSASTSAIEALSAPGLFTSTDQAVRVISDPLVREADPRVGREQGPDRRRDCADRAVLDRHPQAGAPPRRLQGHEDPRAGLAVPAGADQAHGRLADRDDARRRAARPPAGHHRRRARHHHRLHHDAVPRCGEVRRRERSALPQLDHRDEQEVARYACLPICRRSCATMRKAPPPRSCRS